MPFREIRTGDQVDGNAYRILDVADPSAITSAGPTRTADRNCSSWELEFRWFGHRSATECGGLHIAVFPSHMVDVISDFPPSRLSVITRMDDRVVAPLEGGRVAAVGLHLGVGNLHFGIGIVLGRIGEEAVGETGGRA